MIIYVFVPSDGQQAAAMQTGNTIGQSVTSWETTWNPVKDSFSCIMERRQALIVIFKKMVD